MHAHTIARHLRSTIIAARILPVSRIAAIALLPPHVSFSTRFASTIGQSKRAARRQVQEEQEEEPEPFDYNDGETTEYVYDPANDDGSYAATSQPALVSPSQAWDKIHLKNLTFFAHHGVHGFETTYGQPFEVDLELEVDLTTAGQTDEISCTVDYTAIHAIVKKTVEGPPKRLVERVAMLVIDNLLERFPKIHSVKINLRKPKALMGGILDSVGIEMWRERAPPAAAEEPYADDAYAAEEPAEAQAWEEFGEQQEAELAELERALLAAAKDELKYDDETNEAAPSTTEPTPTPTSAPSSSTPTSSAPRASTSASAAAASGSSPSQSATSTATSTSTSTAASRTGVRSSKQAPWWSKDHKAAPAKSASELYADLKREEAKAEAEAKQIKSDERAAKKESRRRR